MISADAYLIALVVAVWLRAPWWVVVVFAGMLLAEVANLVSRDWGE